MCFTPTYLNKALIIIAFFLTSHVFGQYAKYFPNQFNSAIHFFHENQSSFQKIADSTGKNVQFVFSIVAPEIGHYSWMKNSIESNSLKVLYVQLGHGYADFSVGYFQMKPSFIERLEMEIQQNDDLKKRYSKCIISSNEDRLKRIERIKRLESLEWQLYYLAAFIEITQLKFPQVFDNPVNELKFYSTAYNTGFQKSVSQIQHEYERKRFPNMSERKFNYSSVSIEYYRNLKSE